MFVTTTPKTTMAHTVLTRTYSLGGTGCFLDVKDLATSGMSAYEYINARFDGNKVWQVQYHPGSSYFWLMRGRESWEVPLNRASDHAVEIQWAPDGHPIRFTVGQCSRPPPDLN